MTKPGLGWPGCLSDVDRARKACQLPEAPEAWALLSQSVRQGGLCFHPVTQSLCPLGADDLRVTQVEAPTFLLAKWLEEGGIPSARGSELCKDSAFELI